MQNSNSFELDSVVDVIGLKNAALRYYKSKINYKINAISLLSKISNETVFLVLNQRL